jgi:replicative DNA helicase
MSIAFADTRGEISRVFAEELCGRLGNQSASMAVTDSPITKGLPGNIDAERSVLGAILLDNSAYNQAAAMLTAEDFVLDSHRRLFFRIQELADRSRPIDLVTLSEELMRNNELEAIGGAGYLASLTDGLPRLSNIEHYARIVKDKSMLRRLINISNSIATRAIEGAEAAEDILDSAESMVLSVGEAQVRTGFSHFRDIFRESMGSLDALHDRGKRVTGLETGFRKFDDMTRGLQASDLIIIAARPSMGKTSFALNIAQHVAVRMQQPVGIFSLEMSKEALVMRLLCGEAKVNGHRLQAGFASRDDWSKLAQALGRLIESPFFIDDTPGISITEMRAKARRLQAEHGLGLLIVDYLQLMSGRGRQENRTQEISSISRGLKGLAKELKVPLIAISQLSRAPEERGGRPRLSDLRESGQIEQDADLVGFIFREESIKPTDENRGKAELIIEKQRNGPTGTINLAFLAQYTSFENLADEFGSEDM